MQVSLPADSQGIGTVSSGLIADGHNEIYVSAASSWEISIKRGMGKLELPSGEIDRIVEEERFIGLPISLFHGQQAGQLPLIHRDPFDRMLVAQAQSHGLVIMTADPIIPEYGIATLQANR